MSAGGRLGALAVAAAVALGGCAGDGPDAGEAPAPTGSPTEAPTVSASPTASTPSTTPTPTVEPATGILLTEASSSVRAPAGWKRMPDLVDYASAASGPMRLTSLDLVDSGDISGGASLEVLATSALHSLPEGARAERLPDVLLDGQTAFHIHYTVPGDPREYDVFTTIRKGRNVGLDFILHRKYVASNPDVIASVLATFTWIA